MVNHFNFTNKCKKYLTLPLWKHKFPSNFYHILYPKKISQEPIEIIPCNKQHKTKRIRQLLHVLNFALNVTFFWFVCGFSYHMRFFTHMETLPLPGRGCIFWPMFGTHGHWAVREGSLLVCHTYWDTGHPFIWSSPRTRDKHTYYRAFNSWAVTT